MEDLRIEPSDCSPLVDFKSNGQLLLEGECRPENVADYFEPILTWLNQLVDAKPSEVVLDFKLEYYNSSSAKFIMEILLILNHFDSAKVNWYFDEMDEDLQESGEEFEKLVDYSFEFFPIEEE